MPFYANFYQDRGSRAGLALEQMLVRRLLTRIARHVPAGGAVLELGPGAGVFAELCRDAGYQYSAIEGNDARAAEMRDEGFDTIAGRFPPINAPDASLDCIFSKHVLEHMSSWQDLDQLLQSARKCLKPGGIIVSICPDAFSQGAQFWNIDYSHVFPTTAISLQKLLVDCGFDVLGIEYTSGPFIGWPRLPLQALNWFNPARLWYKLFPPRLPLPKLYKLWITFLQSVIVIARSPAPE
jgi:SAM-dependent methyltransferase